jgi:hypothetical protein
MSPCRTLEGLSQAACRHDQTAIPFACKRCHAALDLVGVAHVDRAYLYPERWGSGLDSGGVRSLSRRQAQGLGGDRQGSRRGDAGCTDQRRGRAPRPSRGRPAHFPTWQEASDHNLIVNGRFGAKRKCTVVRPPPPRSLMTPLRTFNECGTGSLYDRVASRFWIAWVVRGRHNCVSRDVH